MKKSILTIFCINIFCIICNSQTTEMWEDYDKYRDGFEIVIGFNKSDTISSIVYKCDTINLDNVYVINTKKSKRNFKLLSYEIYFRMGKEMDYSYFIDLQKGTINGEKANYKKMYQEIFEKWKPNKICYCQTIFKGSIGNEIYKRLVKYQYIKLDSLDMLSVPSNKQINSAVTK